VNPLPSSFVVPTGIHGLELESVATDAGALWFPVADQVMRDHIRSAGTWEPEIGRVLRQIFPARGGTFVDVGANVGYFSAFMANAFTDASIHAFEPHPMTYGVLRLNCWPYGERIRTYPCAISDRRGTVALVTSDNNLGDTKGLHAADRQRASVVAAAATLDEVLDGVVPDVVKIDVQGAEFAVLGGMTRLIAKSPHMRVVMEFSPDMLVADKVEPATMLAAIRAKGYALYLIRQDGFIEATDQEIIAFCQSAGPLGQANILLSSPKRPL